MTKKVQPRLMRIHRKQEQREKRQEKKALVSEIVYSVRWLASASIYGDGGWYFHGQMIDQPFS